MLEIIASSLTILLFLKVPLVFLVLFLLYIGRGYLAWVLGGIVGLWMWRECGCGPTTAWKFFATMHFLLAVLFGLPPLRRQLISRFLRPIFASLLPKMSETERVALEAGTVWWDGEIFSGKPQWSKLLEFSSPGLTIKEKAFVNGPTETLCRMLNDWEITQKGDLPPEIWQYLKKERFFGMIIPESYGGLGFSAAGHSAVITKLGSRCLTATVTAMVPNSLGPAELLMHYGTDAQKQHYLPRLAVGDEIPCFALTGPEAGSDAAGMTSSGVVCRGLYQGKEVLGMRLNWDKRYTTLGPIATVLGLAFNLQDPDRLLGGPTEYGITCALVPANLPGIKIGTRHDPGVPFQNGPSWGTDVFVPVDCIIGGAPMAGKGWRMLMECLSVGRSISLPSLSVGGAQLAARVASAYAMVREQFNLPIGRFEGVEEPMARIGAMSYMMNAARRLTLGGVDRGQKPSVISAVMKYYSTETMRRIINDAMDITAGAGISRGPRNLLSTPYVGAPIGITVEGANILTRTLIIFGQGAIRCHPFVQSEMKGAQENDLVLFDRAFFGHVNFSMRNAARALLLGITGGRFLVRVPGLQGDYEGLVRRYFGQLSRLSAAFALMADVAMGIVGGDLKRKEKITGRFADSLGWMYFAMAALKQFHDDRQPARDLPFLRWSVEHALANAQTALIEIIHNFPLLILRWALKLWVFPLGASLRQPLDSLTESVARGMMDNDEMRHSITTDMYLPKHGEDHDALYRLERAFEAAREAQHVQRKIKDAVRARKLEKGSSPEAAERAGVINVTELEILKRAVALRDEAIQVDDFPQNAYPR